MGDTRTLEDVMYRNCRWVAVGLLLSLSPSFVLFASGPLSFEERLKAQEAIERVYYNHRLWPKENPQPKPPFEEMVPRAVIEAKVRDSLKKEAALELLWQRPITREQLQAELNRMARASRDTATLTELFVAHDYDAQRVAECLAKPLLVDRLLRNAYASDASLHAAARGAAEAALRRLSVGATDFPDPAANAGGRVRYVLEAQIGSADAGPGASGDSRIVPVSLDVLRGLLEEAPRSGRVSLVERDGAFLVVRTLSSDGSHLESEWLVFPKVPFDAWWAKESARFAPSVRGGVTGSGCPRPRLATTTSSTTFRFGQSLPWLCIRCIPVLNSCASTGANFILEASHEVSRAFSRHH